MIQASIPAKPLSVDHSGTTPADLTAAFERTARVVDHGERRAWDLPEALDATPTAAQVAMWLRQTLAVPWCLDGTSVDEVCAQFGLLLADTGRPGRVEVLCQMVRHRKPTVYLAVYPWHDGALQPPRFARVEATVGSES
jgi:hypothetical protein